MICRVCVWRVACGVWRCNRVVFVQAWNCEFAAAMFPCQASPTNVRRGTSCPWLVVAPAFECDDAGRFLGGNYFGRRRCRPLIHLFICSSGVMAVVRMRNLQSKTGPNLNFNNNSWQNGSEHSRRGTRDARARAHRTTWRRCESNKMLITLCVSCGLPSTIINSRKSNL